MPQHHPSLSGPDLATMGAQRAADHAEFQSPGWIDVALEAVRLHAMRNRYFRTEQVRAAFQEIPPPPDHRAWGNVMRKAAAAGIIVADGCERATSPGVHAMWVTRWRSLVS